MSLILFKKNPLFLLYRSTLIKSSKEFLEFPEHNEDAAGGGVCQFNSV